MRLFLTRKELKLRRKRTIVGIVCLALVVGIYWVLTRPHKAKPEIPTVIVEPAERDNVEIFGEYVGRIRAQQFVEVRARVEGYLESMLFAEGTYVNKNQVLFVINQDQYRAKADKARAQLKKDEAQALKAKRDLERIKPLYAQNAASQLDLDNAEAAYESAVATVAMSEADLAQIKEELMEYGYIKKHYDRKKGQKVQSKSKPFHYVTEDGYDIYVGKNNFQNDELTFKFANGNDWWFHAKKMPGSHVIVRTGGKELPDRTFEEAASLAAYYSKGRDQDKVEIDYVIKKEVKKPASAKPGFVVYYTNYSMMASTDISAIKQAD